MKVRDEFVIYVCLGIDMCDTCIKLTQYDANSFFSIFHVLALQIEIFEGASVVKSNTKNIEHAVCTKTCLSLMLQHFYKLNFIWSLT